jgi:NAD(P)-dependent dehydrogenase (short-subunit alcohol dehydrogenase family)
VSKTWFITGTSRGLGRSWAEAALERGDKVAATARNASSLKDLPERFGDAVLPISLDVTDRNAAFAAVQEAHSHFGGLDVVVNNAGFGHFGFIEELTEQEARAQLETNLFGALWVTQAAIPFLREQGHGHFLQVSSVGGVAAFRGVGAYHASKWGLEGFSDALSQEMAPFGVKVTIIEPGGYATDWGGASAAHSTQIPAYQPARDALAEEFGRPAPGPEATIEAVLAAVDAAEPPLRLPLSGIAYDFVTGLYGQRLDAWKQWESVSRSADGS